MASGFTCDSSRSGINSFFKDHQIMALQILWSKPEGVVSKEVWIEVNERLGSARANCDGN